MIDDVKHRLMDTIKRKVEEEERNSRRDYPPEPQQTRTPSHGKFNPSEQSVPYRRKANRQEDTSSGLHFLFV